MFLSRVLCPDGRPALALRQGSEAALVRGGDDLAGLFAQAAAEGVSPDLLLLRRGLGDPVDIAGLLAQGRVLSPLPAEAVILLPVGPGEQETAPVLPPCAALAVPAHGALEGGAAVVLFVRYDGRPVPLGWVQTHGVSGGAGVRGLSCGPELCLALAAGPGLGRTRLYTETSSIAEFPVVGPEEDWTLPEMPSYPPGSVILHRATRWLLRPRWNREGAMVETRIAGLGLPLCNGVGREAMVERRMA